MPSKRKNFKKYQRKSGRRTNSIINPRSTDNPQEEDAIQHMEVDAVPPSQAATGAVVSGLPRSPRLMNKPTKAKETAKTNLNKTKTSSMKKKKNSIKSSLEKFVAFMREQVHPDEDTIENNALNIQFDITSVVRQIYHKFLSRIPFRFWSKR